MGVIVLSLVEVPCFCPLEDRGPSPAESANALERWYQNNLALSSETGHFY